MSGPNSAPNGDRSLTTNEKVYCEIHKDKLEKCNSTCKQMRKRDMLALQGLLFTGKTDRKI